ncbi:hypothetical protein [Actinokineospora sp. NPDC004072]
MAGDVSGQAVLARDIHGSVTLHQHNYYGPLGRRPVALPYRFGRVPPRAEAFLDRQIASVVARALDEAGSAVLTSGSAVRTGVLSGLGGVGKTQLAIDHAERAWAAGHVDLLVWVTASTRAAVVADYARLAQDLTGVEDADPEWARGACWTGWRSAGSGGLWSWTTSRH